MQTVDLPSGMIFGYLLTFLFGFGALILGAEFWIVMLAYWIAGPMLGVLFTAFFSENEEAARGG